MVINLQTKKKTNKKSTRMSLPRKHLCHKFLQAKNLNAYILTSLFSIRFVFGVGNTATIKLFANSAHDVYVVLIQRPKFRDYHETSS